MNCILFHFRFRNFNEERTKWQTLAVNSPNTTSYTIYGLQPDTGYEFMVLSRNHYGDGNYSERVQAKTTGMIGQNVHANAECYVHCNWLKLEVTCNSRTRLMKDISSNWGFALWNELLSFCDL